MEIILKKFPILEGKVTEIVHSKEKDYMYMGVKITDLFYRALATEEGLGHEMSNSITGAIARYLEFPSIVHSMSDIDWKAFKLTTAPPLREYLRETKLHRTIIANMCLAIEILPDLTDFALSDEIERTRKEILASVDSVTGSTPQYVSWSKNERLDFVENKVKTFVRKLCIDYITSRAQ